jgi:hypothetical protein
MSDQHDNTETGTAEDILELFNAKDAIENPDAAGEEEPLGGPASDAPAPPG